MQIQQLHQILYEMLCSIDDACRSESVPYMLGGGTLLGAVREHGFIPWDDDVDLAVWAKDYPAMKEALKKHLPPYMRLIEPQDFSPDFWDFICRVQDTRYHWHTPSDEDLYYDNQQNHISVDIFIISYSSNNQFAHRYKALLQKITYGLALGHRKYHNDQQFSLLQKAEVRLLSSIGRYIPLEKIFYWYSKLLNFSPTEYCFIVNNIPAYMSLPYKSEWFQETQPLLFIDRYFPVQTGYKQKLFLQYGDYMTPKKDRDVFITHMNFSDEGETK